MSVGHWCHGHKSGLGLYDSNFQLRSAIQVFNAYSSGSGYFCHSLLIQYGVLTTVKHLAIWQLVDVAQSGLMLRNEIAHLDKTEATWGFSDSRFLW